jgi:hypothetical protein
VAPYPPQNPRDLTWDRTRAAAVGSLSYGTPLAWMVSTLGFCYGSVSVSVKPDTQVTFVNQATPIRSDVQFK